jgi:hypothetical protein
MHVYLYYALQIEFRRHTTRGDGYMSQVEFMIAMGFPPLGNEKPLPPPVKVAPVKSTPVKKPKNPKFQ